MATPYKVHGEHDSGVSFQDPEKSTFSEGDDFPLPPKTFSKVSEDMHMLTLAKRGYSTSDALPTLQTLEEYQASKQSQASCDDLSLDDTAAISDPAQGQQQSTHVAVTGRNIRHILIDNTVTRIICNFLRPYIVTNMSRRCRNMV